MNKYILITILVLIPIMGNSQGKKLNKYGIRDSSVPSGLKIGTKAPEFKAVDQNGYLIDLKSMLKDGSVVLVFYRGYWCPYCSKTLKNYADSIEMVTGKGAWFIAVTPETTLGIAKTIEETNLKFSVISDQDESIMKLYDVSYNVTDDYQKKIKRFKRVSIAENNGKQVATLPVPATYIIDQSGNIVYRQFDYDYRKRASIGEIVANLPK